MPNLIPKFTYQIRRRQAMQNAQVNQPLTVWRKAWLGDNQGNIFTYNGQTLPPGYVVVRDFDGNLSVAFNQRAPTDRPGIPINVGYDPLQPTLFQVLGQFDTYLNQPGISIPPHHKTHEWPSSDAVYVNAFQFLPALVTGNSGMIITIFPSFFLKSDGTWNYLAYQTLDLTSHMPATGALPVLISVKDDATIAVTNGTAVATPEIVTVAKFPAAPSSLYHPICAVRLFSGQTVIRQEASYTDIFDLRWLSGSGGGGGGGGAPTGPAGGDLAGTYPNPTLNTLVLNRGLHSARPTATGTQHYYFETDTTNLFQDTAAGPWTQIASIGGASATAFVTNEVPGGAVNGSNTAFTTVSAFISGTLRVYLNGQRLKAGGVDFTEGSSAFTMAVAPFTGDVLLVDYNTAISGTSGLIAGAGINISGSTVSSNIDNGTAQTTIADADEVGLWNAVAAAFRKITWANFKLAIKAYTDTLYFIGAARIQLTAARTYYVATTGNDANDGLTVGAPFLTIQHAVDVASALDNGGFDITIQIADGTYAMAAGVITLKSFVGSGKIIIQGNTTTWANVLITKTGGVLFSGTSVVGVYQLQGFKTTGTGSYIVITGIGAPTTIFYQQIEFGTGYSYHVDSEVGAFVKMIGAYKISGGCISHVISSFNGTTYLAFPATVTLVGTPAWGTAFLMADRTGVILCYNTVTFSGAATGKRAEADSNGVIDTLGGKDAFLPGNAAGTTSTGGQYI